MIDEKPKAWLDEAMTRWETSLVRMCFACLGDTALAEDAVQETFLKTWKGYGKFRGDAGEKTWLLRIAINTCKDVRRGAWFRRIDSSVALENLPETSEPFRVRDDTVTRAIMALPPRLKEVVLLHWYHGLTGEETADVLRVSRSTAYHRLQRARDILKKELEDWYREE